MVALPFSTWKREPAGTILRGLHSAVAFPTSCLRMGGGVMGVKHPPAAGPWCRPDTHCWARRADGTNNHLLPRPNVHSKWPSWSAPAQSELVQCPQPAGRGLSPACCGGWSDQPSCQPHCLLKTEFILSVLWKAPHGVSLLAQEKGYSESGCVEPAHQQMWDLVLKSPSLFAWLKSRRGLSLGTVGQCG